MSEHHRDDLKGPAQTAGKPFPMQWIPVRLIKRIMRSAFCSKRLVILKAALPRTARPAGDNTASPSVREITALDRAMVAAIPLASAAGEFSERLSSASGVLISDNEGPAGYAWCTGSPRQREGVAPFLFPVRPTARTLYIFDVLVVPGKQGRGYGRLLLESLLARADRQGRHSVFLITGAHNRRMRRLCCSLGFSEAGTLTYFRVLNRVWSDTHALKIVCEETD
jgi:GNAT superfamily N-acetyltransferase